MAKTKMPPPVPPSFDWGAAEHQQRLLSLQPGKSTQEIAYEKWLRGIRTERQWAALSFLERAQWSQFYFDPETQDLYWEVDEEAQDRMETHWSVFCKNIPEKNYASPYTKLEEDKMKFSQDKEYAGPYMNSVEDGMKYGPVERNQQFQVEGMQQSSSGYASRYNNLQGDRMQHGGSGYESSYDKLEEDSNKYNQGERMQQGGLGSAPQYGVSGKRGVQVERVQQGDSGYVSRYGVGVQRGEQVERMQQGSLGSVARYGVGAQRGVQVERVQQGSSGSVPRYGSSGQRGDWKERGYLTPYFVSDDMETDDESQT
jgi:hypothetical protein